MTSFDLVHDRLTELAHLSSPLARAFAGAGYSLYAVGGSVRDAILGEPRREDFEIDYTTNARPDDIVVLMKPLCTSLWEQGRSFGTIGGLLREGGIKAEITTFRSEAYVDHSRKPAVEWGDSLEADLSRRDFTINALALDVVALDAGTAGVQTLFDFHDGFNDLYERILRTPIDPEILFSDDPLRMMRAARFAARFAMTIDPAIEAAATRMAEKLEKVSRGADSWRARPLDDDGATLDRARFHRSNRPRRPLLPRTAQVAAGTGPDSPAQGRLEAHLGGRGQDLARVAPSTRRTVPRHRQTQHAGPSATKA